MSKKISIIIPVYNVGKYLSQCLESVINQSYRDLEILLIDDGSRDSSARVCDDYSALDSRITVVHQKNNGAASARNVGLSATTGAYLAFVDGDDFLDLNMYSDMMEIMNRTQADIVECAFLKEFRNKTEERKLFNKEIEYSTIEYLARYTNNWDCGLLWNKLFKRELFNGIFFEEGHRIDDEFFTYQGVMNAKKVVYTPKALYHYRMRASSVMQDKTAAERMLFDRLEYSTTRREKVVSSFPELKRIFDYAYLDSLMFWSKDSATTAKVICEIQRLLKEYFKNNKPCKMNPRFRLQLLQLQYATPERFIRKRQIQEPKKDENQYYE